MGLNPFKESNISDLQKQIQEVVSKKWDSIRNNLLTQWEYIKKRGNERLTIMVIPHSEKKIVNLHVTLFTLTGIIASLILILTLTSILIINHTSTIKEVSRLKMYGSNSKIQIAKYKEEVNKLYDIFQRLKPELSYLYSLTPGNRADTLWAKGGVSENIDVEQEQPSPPIEILNIEEMVQDLETAKDVLKDIKKFMRERRKVIENTPSMWPVDGFVIARYGIRTSPYTFQKEFHEGVDIASFPGAPIKVTAPGVVESVRWDSQLGLTVSVKHKYGFVTAYSHCQRVTVEEGQKVTKGEVIGYVGKTGNATRHICFYQIQIGTEFVDPLPYLNKVVYQ
jgi:murein DD-endopeptidase MepM/ murein hydrolase activator NlpD